jgi:hypothetical protein
MLTGNVPFHDDNPMTVIQMHLQAQIPPMPDSIPYSVQQIVRRALEKDAGRRYQSSGEMMQHCQQVFAEVSQGGMSIGAGGMPKTMIAGGGMPMQGHPGMQQQPQQGYGQPQQGYGQGPQGGQGGTMPGPGGAPQGGYQQASAAQKTMVAQASPFAGGQMPGQMPQGGMPGGMPQGGQPQGGYSQANPMQKTMVAGMAPQIPQPGQLPPGMTPGMVPGMQHGMQPGMQQPGGGPAKTVALQTSEGVVSVARTGQALQPAGTAAVQQGASALFWIVSLIVGIGVGVLAYVIVLQTM